MLEDEEELLWAAIEKFPQHQQTNLALLRRTPSEQGKEDYKTETIDGRMSDHFSRELFVRNALATNEQDNYRLLFAIKERLYRWGSNL
ncbi:ABC transporter G family member 31-like [Carya illinoinensis]|uniref:Uncharacterized protein n=1 Tax=Carya illinoinensis TaxID=32201 RepID=A0A8T1QMB4_CARIL|nr:ABC transporter G family member 31-like [Carya illinoinensis]KAG6655555.1 hypothetical protein CIPAW_05G225200 [Carya illinoinensis]